jgi:uncharacterized protein YqeY
MPGLKDDLRADLTRSMKARDALRSSTLRMALTAITTAEVSGKQARELSDDQILDVLISEAKKRREAASAYDEAGRTDLANKERAESAVLAEYLPKPLGDDELTAIVARAITDTGAAADGLTAMGKVMGTVQPQVKGRADGSVVAAEVRRQLTTS